MGCGCDQRARRLLELLGYQLINNWWMKEDVDSIPDMELNKAHFYLSFKALRDSLNTELVRNLYEKIFREREIE